MTEAKLHVLLVCASADEEKNIRRAVNVMEVFLKEFFNIARPYEFYVMNPTPFDAGKLRQINDKYNGVVRGVFTEPFGSRDLSTSFDGGFDVVFFQGCQIYSQMAARMSLFHDEIHPRIMQAVKPGGYLLQAQAGPMYDTKGNRVEPKLWEYMTELHTMCVPGRLPGEGCQTFRVFKDKRKPGVTPAMTKGDTKGEPQPAESGQQGGDPYHRRYLKYRRKYLKLKAQLDGEGS